MKANELRIGDLVTYEGMISIVSEITCTDIVLDHPAYEEDVEASVFDIEPIPLTEDWLIKFGFEKDEHDNNYELLGFDVVLYENQYFYSPISEYFNECKVGIEHVHELQNLFYAIKGKEIKK